MTDTVPKRLTHNSDRFRNRPAIREKALGIWQTWTWWEMQAEIFAFAHGLAALGYQRGDRFAIIGKNRPRMYWGMAAVQCLRGIPVPAYADSSISEIQYILSHTDACCVLVEDQEQVDKVLEVLPNCGAIKQIIFDNPRGLRHYDQPKLYDFQSIQVSGRQFARENPGFLEDEINKGCGGDIAVLLYTSGTTGTPKGVVLSHDNVLLTSGNSAKLDHLSEKDDMLSYLPLAWVGDHIFFYGQAYITGMCINCPENELTLANDLREIGPSYYVAPPGVFENLLTTVMIRMEDAGIVKQKLFTKFLKVAEKSGAAILNGASISIKDRIIYMLGNWLIYAPLKNMMGFTRIRAAYVAGDAISSEAFNFFRGLGINIKQLYGQTESAALITAQPDNEVYTDTVGKPLLGVAVKITDDGEVAFQGQGVFQGYYKNGAATKAVKNEGGWVLTGDSGCFDDRGHLKIFGRTKDIGKLSNGKLFAPKYIENKLKYFPQIREAVVFGTDRPYVAAFINIDLDAARNWAERNQIIYTSYQELARNPKVYHLILNDIKQLNQNLATDTMLVDSQIRRFLILHKELDADDGELTRTGKVQRNVIAKKYGMLIAALYSDMDTCYVETEVVFENGRIGNIAADIKIMDVGTFSLMEKAS